MFLNSLRSYIYRQMRNINDFTVVWVLKKKMQLVRKKNKLILFGCVTSIQLNKRRSQDDNINHTVSSSASGRAASSYCQLQFCRNVAVTSPGEHGCQPFQVFCWNSFESATPLSSIKLRLDAVIGSRNNVLNETFFLFRFPPTHFCCKMWPLRHDIATFEWKRH